MTLAASGGDTRKCELGPQTQLRNNSDPCLNSKTVERMGDNTAEDATRWGLGQMKGTQGKRQVRSSRNG
jgi:hypothetical protein